MKIAAIVVLAAIIALGLWARVEDHLEHNEIEYQIREWGSTQARQIYAEAEHTLAAKRTREELIKTWARIR